MRAAFTPEPGKLGFVRFTVSSIPFRTIERGVILVNEL